MCPCGPTEIVVRWLTICKELGRGRRFAQLMMAARDDGAVGDDSHNWRWLAGTRGAWVFVQLTGAGRDGAVGGGGAGFAQLPVAGRDATGALDSHN